MIVSIADNQYGSAELTDVRAGRNTFSNVPS